MGIWRAGSLGILLAAAATPALAVQTPITINLVNTGGAGVGTPAYNGFRVAADYWQSVLTTSQPTTITIDIGFNPLGPGILGSTGSTFVTAPIFGVENRIRAGGTGVFDQIAARNLPTLYDGQYGAGTAVQVYTPGYTDPVARTGIDNSTKVYDTDGSTNNSFVALTSANAKALGYTVTGAASDASITFSSDFGFDFDPRDGISGNSYDFVGVAIHEMGHALGFVSGVDIYDYYGTGGPGAGLVCLEDGTLCQNYPANDDVFADTLDLFRYSDAGALDWTTKTASYFSIDSGLNPFKSGFFSTGTYTGDGYQASHWKDNVYLPRTNPACSNVSTASIGIMDPTFGACEQGRITALDLAAFDAIGYNTTVNVLGNYAITTAQIGALFASDLPEPASWAMMILGFGAIGTTLRTRRVRVAFG